MEEFQLNAATISAILLSLIFLWFMKRTFLKPLTTIKRKVPPSPRKLPIIGNMHQMESVTHRGLHSMAQKHGPIMLLHLGSVPVLIISSAELAREVMRTHDLIFASRPNFKAPMKLTYGCIGVGYAPYGEHWRHMKTILITQLLNNKRVQSFRSITEEETALFVKNIRECSGSVDLSAMFACYANDVIGRAAFGRKCSESPNGKKFLGALTDLMEFLGGINNIADFVPWLAWINRFNGFNKRLDKTAQEMDQVLENFIQERHRFQTQQDVVNQEMGQDFLDVLLQIYDDQTVYASIGRDSIKILILRKYSQESDLDLQLIIQLSL